MLVVETIVLEVVTVELDVVIVLVVELELVEVLVVVVEVVVLCPLNVVVKLSPSAVRAEGDEIGLFAEFTMVIFCTEVKEPMLPSVPLISA